MSSLARLLPIAAVAVFSSCATVKSTLEAKPANPSEFLDPSHRMEEMGARSPFLRTWRGATQEQRQISAKRTQIFIAPVNTSHLRPIGAKIAARQDRRWNRERPVREIAHQLRSEFVEAFKQSKHPRYFIVHSPTKDSVTLELSLVELDPSSVTGNIVRKGASLQIGPTTALAAPLTSGRIAIEGRLTDSTEGWSLFEFADREKDKMTFWTLRDFRPYGHSKVTIKEWARQFEETTRNPGWREMGDARIWTLWPW